MDYGLIISSAAGVVTVGLYIVALWIGDHRTISALSGAADLAVALSVIAIGLAFALGLSVHLLGNPNSWLHAVGELIQCI